jgi:antitoxin HicB
MKYRVIIEQDENGVFVVECPALPGCVSQGDTYDEALKNIKDAIQGYV